MRRRHFISGTLISGVLMSNLRSAEPIEAFENAGKILEQAVQAGQIQAATMVARKGNRRFEHAWGTASIDSSFLLGSITKPMALAAVMHLFEENKFSLDEPACKYLPEFKGEQRETITIKQLMTHVSGLPDQLPENGQLRRDHSALTQFAQAAMKTPLGFAPGSRYQYSSMAILLACEIAQRLSGKSILALVQEHVVEPLACSIRRWGMVVWHPSKRCVCKRNTQRPKPVVVILRPAIGIGTVRIGAIWARRGVACMHRPVMC